MSAPDYSRGYLRVPLGVWLSTFCRGTLTRRQRQIVAFVIRESWGWHDRAGRPFAWTRPLRPAAFADATGIAPEHVRRELRALVARGVLAESSGRYTFEPERDLRQAVSARPRPGAKTATDSKRNVAAPGGPDRAAAFAALLSGFAGALPPRQERELRRWVGEAGPAAVWARLAGGFAAGPAPAREALLAALAEREDGNGA